MEIVYHRNEYESIYLIYASLDVRSLKKGTYTVSLRMKDPYTKNYIHFANKGYEKSKTVPVGTLTLQ